MTNTEKARIGDKIIVTNSELGSLLGVQCVVTERPSDKSPLNNESECVWAKRSDQEYDDIFWIRHTSYRIIKKNKFCADCKSTGKITLLNFTVDCDCQKTCEGCSSEYCECSRLCDPDKSQSCARCGVWTCEACLIEGMCHICFQKFQGGVK